MSYSDGVFRFYLACKLFENATIKHENENTMKGYQNLTFFLSFSCHEVKIDNANISKVKFFWVLGTPHTQKVAAFFHLNSIRVFTSSLTSA